LFSATTRHPRDKVAFHRVCPTELTRPLIAPHFKRWRGIVCPGYLLSHTALLPDQATPCCPFRMFCGPDAFFFFFFIIFLSAFHPLKVFLFPASVLTHLVSGSCRSFLAFVCVKRISLLEPRVRLVPSFPSRNRFAGFLLSSTLWFSLKILGLQSPTSRHLHPEVVNPV